MARNARSGGRASRQRQSAAPSVPRLFNDVDIGWRRRMAMLSFGAAMVSAARHGRFNNAWEAACMAASATMSSTFSADQKLRGRVIFKGSNQGLCWSE
jgi:hypothetical protein